MKGADDTICRFLKKQWKEDEILEQSSEYAKIGLRTLAFAKKNLSEKELSEFLTEHNKEDNSMALSLIEKDMDFLGNGLIGLLI